MKVIVGNKCQLKLIFFFFVLFWQNLLKMIFPVDKAKISHFCVCPWLLLTVLNFSAQGPTDTRVISLLVQVAETIMGNWAIIWAFGEYSKNYQTSSVDLPIHLAILKHFLSFCELFYKRRVLEHFSLTYLSLKCIFYLVFVTY